MLTSTIANGIILMLSAPVSGAITYSVAVYSTTPLDSPSGPFTYAAQIETVTLSGESFAKGDYVVVTYPAKGTPTMKHQSVSPVAYLP